MKNVLSKMQIDILENLYGKDLSGSIKIKSNETRSLIRTGRYYEDAGSIKKAAEYYQKGIDVDNLCEEICQRLMLCYQRLGLKAEAITAYNRCRNAMTAMLNAEPSARTREIYRQIMEAERGLIGDV